MDTSAVGQTDDWKNTKEAVANFRRLLLCSKCSQLLKDPVCLGTCEHILCRSCAGPQAGEGCVVCRRPSWVKDIQINRQLNSIIQLFCGLESMLNLDGLPVTRAQKAGPVLKHKKNFKIWFSPRSRKVRCMVEKPPKVFIPDTKSLEKAAEPQPHDPVAEVTDLTVFNFTSSSQESDTASPTSRNINQNRKRTNGKIGSRKKTMKRSSKKQRRQMVKKKLDAVNKQWRITEVESTLVESEHLAEEFESRSKRRVSFLSPDVLADIHGLSMASNSPKCSFPAPFIPTLLCQNESDSFHYDPLPACDSTTPKKQATLYSPQHSPKLEGEAITLETTPKRPTASLSRGLKSLGHLSPAAINSSPSSRCNKIPQENGGESPPVPSIVGQKSPSPRASLGRCNSRSPAVVKKNHKGETPLHLAAIKGDVEDVKELLDLGADPNLKDNAGWTPLHEACNLGHLVVVKVLLSRGALLNTPGYENDSPLHDAVRNGHIAIVKLLLQFGASQSVLNLHGKRPADYAGSQEMLEVFQETPEEAQNGNTSITSPSSLSAVDSFAKQEEIVLFLSSKLSQTDQHQCAKLSRLLEGRITDSFTVSVSHIVVPEGPLPSTYSTLLGLLAGCWIVKYSSPTALRRLFLLPVGLL
ncbi:BRCA1-associated RING domain protein 1 isoform X2 [Syngnathoides biaculeatus]|uniref:BRCA1-associated RING domain protein 1 isoform X2 n=1 Tax=Syngnathoides biaculeatus TaxID=300417 RepID=UPI002ADE1251|nr:BRCA1-associated RING domain protein 1 isoform X2 [Syngnathoides biaculeatus]